MEISEALILINSCGIKNSIGKYNSKCMNYKWFVKNNLEELYNIIIDHTTIISDRSFSQRIWAFENLPIPLCECGRPAKKYDGRNEWSNYCCAQCALKSPIRASLISTIKKNADHSISNAKRQSTMLKKYGVITNSQRPDVKQIMSEKAKKRQLAPHTYIKLEDNEWLYEQYVVKDRSALDIAAELGVDYSIILTRARKNGWFIKQVYNKSLVEIHIKDFVESLGFETSTPTNLLKGKQEIDIYVEKCNLAIEVDGLRSHAFYSTDPQKHVNKTMTAHQNGINLIHITDYQWNNHQNIVKSIIKSKLGVTQRIYARKCSIESISVIDAKQFLDDNHIQGYVGCSVRYGLYYNTEIVAVMTFGKPRYSRSYNWELLRFANRCDVTVVGGFSKLISHFQKYHTGSIVSYADMMRSNGSVYERNGFKLVHQSSPGYFWTDGNVVITRYKTMKHKLNKWLPVFDQNLSETQNMINNGYARFWDCGQLVFVKQ